MRVYLCLIILIGVTSCLQYGEDKDTLDKEGRIADYDQIIETSFVLKAIAFGSDDEAHKEVFAWAIDEMEKRLSKYKDKVSKKNAEYYIYVLKNIAKFRAKWLRQEIEHLVVKISEKPKNETEFKMKNNIAKYIYFTAADYGLRLTLNEEPTDLDDWIVFRESLRAKENFEVHSDL